MIETETPSGVEQFIPKAQLFRIAFVIETETPSGVEQHFRTKVLGQSGNVIETETPSGVEQPRSPPRLAVGR